jgi:hypothetical protein
MLKGMMAAGADAAAGLAAGALVSACADASPAAVAIDQGLERRPLAFRQQHRGIASPGEELPILVPPREDTLAVRRSKRALHRQHLLAGGERGGHEVARLAGDGRNTRGRDHRPAISQLILVDQDLPLIRANALLHQQTRERHEQPAARRKQCIADRIRHRSLPRPSTSAQRRCSRCLHTARKCPLAAAHNIV